MLPYFVNYSLFFSNYCILISKSNFSNLRSLVKYSIHFFTLHISGFSLEGGRGCFILVVLNVRSSFVYTFAVSG